MARKEVTYCDKCGRHCGDVDELDRISVYVTVDRKMDAAGSMDDIQETVDLCTPCCGGALSRMLREMPREARVRWLADVRGKRGG